VGAEASAPWADLDGARRSHRAPVAARGGRGGRSCGARRRARCSWPSAPSRRRRAGVGRRAGCTRGGRLGRGGRGTGGGGWRSCVGPWRPRNGKRRRMSRRPRRGAAPLRRGGRPPRRSEPRQARARCRPWCSTSPAAAARGRWRAGWSAHLAESANAAVRSLSSGATRSSLFHAAELH
jgi:hypothetical protein